MERHEHVQRLRSWAGSERSDSVLVAYTLQQAETGYDAADNYEDDDDDDDNDDGGDYESILLCFIAQGLTLFLYSLV